MGLEEKAEARERRGPENGVQDVFFLINEPVWTGAVQENMDGFEEGLPWIGDTLKSFKFCQFQAHKIPCHQGWKRN